MKIHHKWFLVSLIVILFICISTYWMYSLQYSRLISQRDQALQADLVEQKQIFRTEVNELVNDLQFILSVPPIQGIIRAGENAGIDPKDQSSDAIWKQRLGDIFKSYVASHEHVYQIRYIGLANNGLELVRVDKSASGIFKVPETKLQEKGDRDYYHDITNPSFTGIYISSITLNREFGEIQVPHIPTMRVAIQVYSDSGELFGFIIVNADVSSIFERMRYTVGLGSELYITNEDDQFISHPDPTKTFLFEQGLSSAWAVESSESVGGFNVVQIMTPQGMKMGLLENEEIPLVKGINSITVRLFNPIGRLKIEAALNTVYSLMMFLVGALIFALFFLGYRKNVQNQNALNIEKAQTSAIVDGSQDAILTISMDGRIKEWNPSASKMFGYTKEEVVGEYTHDVFKNDSTKAEEEQIRQDLLLGKKVNILETVRRTRSGVDLSVSISASPIRNEENQIVGVSKNIRDITEQKALKHQLEEFNHQLEQQIEERTKELQNTYALQAGILNNAAHAVIASDPDGVISVFNPAAEKLLGYSASEMIGKLTPKEFHLESEVVERASLFSDELGVVVEPGFDVFVVKSLRGMKNEHQWTYVAKSGEHISVYLSVTAMYDEQHSLVGFLGMATDISELVASRQKLEVLKEQLSLASDIADIGIWSWEPSSGEITWNDKMYDVYDLPSGSTIDFSQWLAMLVEDDRDRASEHFERFAQEGGDPEIIFEVISGKGTRKSIQATATIEKSAHNNAIKLIGINRDISEQVRYEQALKDAKNASDLANKTKSEFVANMSHEIRTPMNAIIGLLELLKKTPLDEKQTDYVLKSDGAAKSLLHILNDILDFSKVEAGKLDIDPHPFSVHDLAENVSTVLMANIGSKPLELIIDIDPQLPAFISLDSLRLQQIIVNLAGNAIKFTYEGMVQVKFTALKDEQCLRVDVLDTGIGIAKENQGKILEAFSQAEMSTVREFGGTGLGLIISKKLVELMHGQFFFESVEGQGSTFSVVIPYQTSFDEKVFLPETQSLNVLIIDDLPEAREASQHMIEGLHWHAETAQSGFEALDLLAERAKQNLYFDVILMDWDMPSMGGHETAAKIRSLGSNIFTGKLFIVTAYGNDQDIRALCSDKGIIDDVIQKPMTASMLVDRITEHKLISLKESLNITSSMSRLTGLKLLLVEDNAINQLVAREILEAEGASVDLAVNGQEAIRVIDERNGSYDLVLMDIQMPVLDGYEATRQIRQRYDGCQLPIIAMTANAMASDRKEALTSGMNDHVAKPFNSTNLIRTILKYTSSKEQACLDEPVVVDDTQGTEEGIRSCAPAEAEVLDSEQALARLGNIPDIYCAALEAFLQESETLIDGFKSSVDHETLKQMTVQAHTLKGASATVGADHLSEIAKALEAQLKQGILENYEELLTALKACHPETVRQINEYLNQHSQQSNKVSQENTARTITKAELIQLKDWLEHSNMKALALYEELYGLHDPLSKENLSGMKHYIDALAFKEAGVWLNRYIAQRDED